MLNHFHSKGPFSVTYNFLVLSTLGLKFSRSGCWSVVWKGWTKWFTHFKATKELNTITCLIFKKWQYEQFSHRSGLAWIFKIWQEVLRTQPLKFSSFSVTQLGPTKIEALKIISLFWKFQPWSLGCAFWWSGENTYFAHIFVLLLNERSYFFNPWSLKVLLTLCIYVCVVWVELSISEGVDWN